MKKIVFVNTNQAWGGGEKWHFNMAKALIERGYDCSFITHQHSELATKCIDAGISVKRFKISNLSFLNPIKLWRLRRIIKSLCPEVVILNLPADAKLAAPAAYLAGVECIIYRRGMPKTLKATLINRIAFRCISYFIANSEEIKRSITRNFPDLLEKTHIIYNGVRLSEPPAKTMHTPVVLGNLGRLVDQKAQYHLINVAKILKKRGVSFRLLIAGKGPLHDKLQSQISAENLDDEVQLIGHTKPDVFFKDIDIFVFSSHYEGSSNALIESMLYGTPAIAFDISSNPEVIEHGQNGYLIAPFDEESFANHIERLSEESDTYALFRSNCAKKLRENFDFEKKVDELEALFSTQAPSSTR